jgi:excinuclease ABC subunit C
VPQRGEKRKLVQMVAQNADQGLKQLRIRRIHESTNNHQALEELQEALSLPDLPRRIECYDISNIQGTNSVGSMVVFEDGRAKPAHYRRFKIKTVAGVDDYSMMREVLTRRFRRLSDSRQKDANAASVTSDGQDRRNQNGITWGIIPNLVLIDGGKGHLGAALQVFLELGINDVPLSSIAKENEELFVPYISDPIVLPRNAQGLFMVQRIRDEAHRFAITFHRERRSKKSVQSTLDLVPGVGPKRKRMLIRRFGSVNGIREASLEEVAAVPGLTLTVARAIKDHI